MNENNYRKGDILTIWVDFGGQRLDEQLVIVERIVRGFHDHYTLKPLQKKTEERLQWSGQMLSTQSRLFLPASEVASILYE